MRQKSLDLGHPHIARMFLVDMRHKAFDLVSISLLGANAVMLQADFVSNLIEQPERLTKKIC